MNKDTFPSTTPTGNQETDIPSPNPKQSEREQWFQDFIRIFLSPTIKNAAGILHPLSYFVESSDSLSFTFSSFSLDWQKTTETTTRRDFCFWLESSNWITLRYPWKSLWQQSSVKFKCRFYLLWEIWNIFTWIWMRKVAFPAERQTRPLQSKSQLLTQEKNPEKVGHILRLGHKGMIFRQIAQSCMMTFFPSRNALRKRGYRCHISTASALNNMKQFPSCFRQHHSCFCYTTYSIRKSIHQM